MARTRAFDDATAVTAARDVFWEHGYSATSLALLQQATGLSKSSLYDTYGSKRELFDRAMTDYLDRVIHPMFAPLERASASGADIHEYFASFGRYFRVSPKALASRGCFMLNTATELNDIDEAAADRVSHYRLRMRAAFRSALDCDSPSAAEADRRADLLTATHIGIMITSRVDLRAAAELADAMAAEFAR